MTVHLKELTNSFSLLFERPFHIHWERYACMLGGFYDTFHDFIGHFTETFFLSGHLAFCMYLCRYFPNE